MDKPHSHPNLPLRCTLGLLELFLSIAAGHTWLKGWRATGVMSSGYVFEGIKY